MMPAEKSSNDVALLQSLLDACRSEYACLWDSFTELERKGRATAAIATAVLVVSFILGPFGHFGNLRSGIQFCLGAAQVLALLSLLCLLLGSLIRSSDRSAFPEQLDRLMDGLGPTETPESVAAAQAVFLQDRLNSSKQSIIDLRDMTERKAGLISASLASLLGAICFIALVWLLIAVS